jgi:hypothetical protein
MNLEIRPDVWSDNLTQQRHYQSFKTDSPIARSLADRSFIVDATFLLDDAEKTFLGSAPLVDSQGRNA